MAFSIQNQIRNMLGNICIMVRLEEYLILGTAAAEPLTCHWTYQSHTTLPMSECHHGKFHMQVKCAFLSNMDCNTVDIHENQDNKNPKALDIWCMAYVQTISCIAICIYKQLPTDSTKLSLYILFVFGSDVSYGCSLNIYVRNMANIC